MSYPFNPSFHPQALLSPTQLQQLEAFREKAPRIRDYILQTQYGAQYQPYYIEQQHQQAPYHHPYPAQYQQYHHQQVLQHAQVSPLPPPPFQQAIYQEPVRSSGPVPVHHQHQQPARAAAGGGGRVAAHRANVSNRAAPYPSSSQPRPRVAPPPSNTNTPGAVLKRSPADHMVIPADDHRPIWEILGLRTRTTAEEKKQQKAEVKARKDALTACSRALLKLEKKKKSELKESEKKREDEIKKAEEAGSKPKGKKTRKARVVQPSEESSSSSLNSDEFVDASGFDFEPLPPSSPPLDSFDSPHHYNHYDAPSSPSSFASSSSTSSGGTYNSSPLASSSSSFGSPGSYGFASPQVNAYALPSHLNFELPQQQAEASFVVADQEEVLGWPTDAELAILFAQLAEELRVGQGQV